MKIKKMLAVVLAPVCAFSALTVVASATSASESGTSAAASDPASSAPTSEAASSTTASGASNASSAPASSEADKGSPNTGVALGIAPVLIAGAAIALVASKKNK